jgi:2-methylisocitrate lyase-like PEP mutase family enzyme
MHTPGRPLILPNIWDAASAAIVAAAGFLAVATSSAAVAEALGYRDGGGTPPAEMLDAIARISAAVDVPVTADVEHGYDLWPADLTERLVAAGAVGCNIEDSEPGAAGPELVNADDHAEFIAAMREAAARIGAPIVINARVDVFLVTGDERQTSVVDDAVKRGRLYLEAGADCVFPILASEPEVIRALTGAIGGPVNILHGPTSLTPAELAALGVARISYGASLFRQVTSRFAGLVEEIGEAALEVDGRSEGNA